MKAIIKTLILLYWLLNIQTLNAQCHMDDWTALKVLFENTNGYIWIDKTNWGVVLSDSPPQNCNLEDLYGIHLDENGRVSCIDLDGIDDCNSGISDSGGNNLFGSLPNEIGNLIALEELYLGKNKIDGEIPSSIGNLSNLIYLDLGFNELEGAIPFEMGNLTNLIEIKLFHNELEGIIPPQFGNLTNLTNLSLASNKLIGPIPPELGNLSNLYRLSLLDNNLSGNIPPELGNLSNLNYLYISDNQFNGYIPFELQGLSNAVRINLSGNHLIGNIPPEFCTLNNLISLEVKNNQLSGCYHEDLLKFCTQLTNTGNPQISDGNNFAASWENFCDTIAGLCTSEPCIGEVIAGCIDPIACNYEPIATCDDDSCVFPPGCINSDVYPGDLNHDGIVNNQDVGLAGLFLYEVGPPRDINHQNTDWNPYPVADWGRQQLNNEDIKHFDCNGDGVITLSDTVAIVNNIDSTWTATQFANPPDNTDYQVMLHYLEQDFDGYLVINVALEKRTGGDLTIKGGYFTIDYSHINANFSNVLLNFSPISWLGIPNNNLWFVDQYRPLAKKIEVGFTKTNNIASEGSGVIGQLILEYDNNAAKRANNVLDFRVNTIAVHSDSTLIPIEDQQLNIDLSNNSCQTNWVISDDTPFRSEYKSNSIIVTNGFVLIGKDQEVEFKANQITLNTGFGVRTGADFRIRIGECD